jgi:hypothetical protein
MAINLQKGQRIDLRKESGATLTDFCVGVNWGAIETKGFLGLSKNVTNVDLDLSCILVNANKQICDHLYSPLYKPEILQRFGLPNGKLVTKEGALRHSGDDLEGDKGGDDGLDNEIITVNLGPGPAEPGCRADLLLPEQCGCGRFFPDPLCQDPHVRRHYQTGKRGICFLQCIGRRPVQRQKRPDHGQAVPQGQRMEI